MLPALVYDVPGPVHIHMPDLLRYQIADRDHRCTVDAVRRCILRNICEESFQCGDIRYVTLDNLCLFGQMSGRFLTPQDKSPHRQLLTYQITYDSAAQISGGTGDDVKFIVDVIH